MDLRLQFADKARRPRHSGLVVEKLERKKITGKEKTLQRHDIILLLLFTLGRCNYEVLMVL